MPAQRPTLNGERVRLGWMVGGSDIVGWFGKTRIVVDMHCFNGTAGCQHSMRGDAVREKI